MCIKIPFHQISVIIHLNHIIWTTEKIVLSYIHCTNILSDLHAFKDSLVGFSMVKVGITRSQNAILEKKWDINCPWEPRDIIYILNCTTSHIPQPMLREIAKHFAARKGESLPFYFILRQVHSSAFIWVTTRYSKPADPDTKSIYRNGDFLAH